MIVKKIINNSRFRFWIYPKTKCPTSIWRKRFKRLGYVIFVGSIRISFTIVK